MKTLTKKQKTGVVAALNFRGFMAAEGPFPPALKSIEAAKSFTDEELAFADYMISDDDFGGCWNDAGQINMHLA